MPAHPFDLVLGRPERDSVTRERARLSGCRRLHRLRNRARQVTRNRRPPGNSRKASRWKSCSARLQPNTRYFYQFRAGELRSPENTFHTQRPPGSSFTFTITADSHLDDRVSAELYQRTLANALADAPDFNIDLGDTFMTREARQPDECPAAIPRPAILLRPTLPLGAVVSGAGKPRRRKPARPRRRNRQPGRLVQSDAQAIFRQSRCPTAFYSGNASEASRGRAVAGLLCLAMGRRAVRRARPVLVSRSKQRGGRDNWKRTLGEEQYHWLARTLETSTAKMKFVFIHHLVGGATPEGRGGAEAAPFYEWGGRNADGSDGFKQNRPGWPAPIHDCSSKNRVTAVFHGHDHLYVKQDLDGIVYQEVPQPGHPRYNRTRTAAEYGYKSGVILGSSGHLRVRVSPAGAKVDYVRAYLPGRRAIATVATAKSADSYTIPVPKLPIPMIADKIQYRVPVWDRHSPRSWRRMSLPKKRPSILAPGAKLQKSWRRIPVHRRPAADAQGNVFFSDIRASRTYRWSPDGKIKLVRENTGNANGLAFDKAGNLLACEGGRGRVVSIDSKGRVSVVADRYQGKPFNQPNDLWIDPKGGVYFSDPIYGRAKNGRTASTSITSSRPQASRPRDRRHGPAQRPGRHCRRKDAVRQRSRGEEDLAYAITSDGSLTDKHFVVPIGADGMKLDRKGNLYLTEKGILIYGPSGKLLETIAVPNEPTNLCFGGPDGRTLFITARPAYTRFGCRAAQLQFMCRHNEPLARLRPYIRAYCIPRRCDPFVKHKSFPSLGDPTPHHTFTRKNP